MQIVIDISEKDFIEIFINGLENNNEIINLIRKGTPLPKHGRLVDADVLIKQLEDTANIEWNEQVGSSKGLEDAIDIVDDAPTIIEADR